ncbi:hypothetical protein ACFSJW_06415 [Flavobacterium artemisiae]|uniref:Uncharacterized protein n=1 Tax=Flavobacterium artemisiae TaxID=2126556 RepID=A0ABW4HCD0_9FLAO
MMVCAFRIMVYATIKITITVCHSDGGGIFARNSTKIGDLLCGATCEDSSSVGMTRLFRNLCQSFKLDKVDGEHNINLHSQ